MNENKTYKEYKNKMNVSPIMQKGDSTNAVVYSFDLDTSKFTYELKMNGQPLSLANASEVNIVLYFGGDDPEKYPKANLVGVIEDKLNGKVSFTMPKQYLGFNGRVVGEIDITFENGQSLTAGHFSFIMKSSYINEGLEIEQQVYVERFEDLEGLLKETSEAIKNNDIVRKPELQVVENNKADKITVDKKISELSQDISNTQIGMLGEFNSESELKAKYPNGEKGFAVVFENSIGYTYTYKNNSWVKGNVWNGMAIQNHSITGKKIQEESLSISKLIGSVDGKNLWNGEFLTGVGIVGGANDGTFTSRENGVCVIVPVEPSTFYAISKTESDLFRIGQTSEFPTQGMKITEYQTIDEAYPGRNTYAVKTRSTDNYLIIYLSVKNIKPTQFQVEKGTEVTSYESPGGSLPLTKISGDFPKERMAFDFQSRRLAFLYGNEATVTVDFTKQAIVTVENGSNVIVVDGKQSSFKANEWSFKDVSSTAVFVFYDLKTASFKFGGHSNYTNAEFDDYGFVGLIRKDPKQVALNGFYNVVGLNSSEKKDKSNFFLTGDNVGWYTPRHDDYTKAITDSFSSTIMYKGYDELVDKDPYYISKVQYATSAGGKPIYRYDLKPPLVASYVKSKRPLPKLVLTGTLHGHEKHASRGLLIFIRNLVLNWKENPELEFIRSNFHIVLIPMVNPDGYDKPAGNTPDNSGPKGRKNGNEVDINRNFGPYWGESGSRDPNHWQYGGPSELSEPESQMLVKLMNEETDAIHFVDFHNYGDFKVFKDIYYVSTNNVEDQNLWLAFGQAYDSKLRKDYPKIDTYKDAPLGAVRSHFQNSWQFYPEYNGRKSILVESVESADNVTNSDMYLVNADNIGNIFLELCKKIEYFL